MKKGKKIYYKEMPVDVGRMFLQRNMAFGRKKEEKAEKES